MSILQQNFLQGCDAFLVLIHCSNGDPEPLREIVAAERSNNNSSGKQIFENGRSVSDVDENKVACARDKFQFQRPELLFQKRAAFIHYLFRSAQMFFVTKGGERAN